MRDNLDTEINYVINLADSMISEGTIDNYFFGLVAASLYNLGRNTEAETYASVPVQYQQADGHVINSVTSITSSQGSNLEIETTAVSIISWMNNQRKYSTNIEKAVQWIVTQVKGGGRYGSTQATVLSLKALVKYMENSVNINGDGNFILSINGNDVMTKAFTQEDKEVILFDLSDIITSRTYSTNFNAGKDLDVKIRVDGYTQTDFSKNEAMKLNVALQMAYYDSLPPTGSSDISMEVQRSFSTELGDTQTKNDILSYQISLQNQNSAKGQGMTVLIFRVPSCLKVDFNQLETLSQNKIFDYFEVRNSNTEVVLYWRQMTPGESKSIQLDFVQFIAGEFCTEKPHTAYLYYNDDQPVWYLIDA